MAARARWAECVVIFGLLVGGVAAHAAAPATATATARERKTKTIQVQVSTERWKGWGQGEPVPEGMTVDRAGEKFTRVETPAGAAPSFSGKVIGIPAGKGAKIGVVANVGTQWIQPANYKFVDIAPDGTFHITADHKPNEEKSLMVQIPGRLAHFLRAEFAPGESAKDVELHLADTKPVVLTMSDAQGRDVRSFRVEVFTPYVLHDEAGTALRIQRLAALPSSSGAIVFESPLEPIAVLLSGGGVAPHYAVIDPREADEFHFKMIAPSRIRGVVTRDGQPVAGQEMYMVNRAAALSVTLRKTDAQGRFDFTGRVPGVQEIRIDNFRTSVRVEPGETTDLNLEIGAAAASPAPAPAR